MRAERIGLAGKRMSGQEVTVPLVDAPTLSLGGFTPRRQAVGAFDASVFSTELADVRGFLSLAFFADTPFTVEHARGAVIVESPATLEMRVRDGAVVAVRIARDEPSIDASFASTSRAAGRSRSRSTGQQAPGPGCEPRIRGRRRSRPRTSARRGERRDGPIQADFTRLARVIRVTDAPAVAQPDPEVMFQRIIHEGLVGDDVSPALHGDVRRLAGTRHLRRRRSRDLGSRPWST